MTLPAGFQESTAFSGLTQPISMPLVTGNGALTMSLVSVSNDSASFASREYADATKRPQLIVTYGG